METTYPDEGPVKVRILHCEAKDPWRLRLRVPAWSKITSLAINSRPRHVVAEDGWLTLERAWKPDDEIAFTIPLPVWLSKPNSDEVTLAACRKG